MFNKILTILICVIMSGCLVSSDRVDKLENGFNVDIIKLQAHLADIKSKIADYNKLHELKHKIDIKDKHKNLVKKFKKATVRIVNHCSTCGYKGPYKASGVIMRSTDTKSYILTAAHVVGAITSRERYYTVNSKSILYDKRCIFLSTDVLQKNCIKYNTMAVDNVWDFAIIEVDKNLNVNTYIGKEYTVGDEVYIVGFPFKPVVLYYDDRVNFSVTTITIDKSYIYRKLLDKSGFYTNVFCINKHSNKGISGGPIFDNDGNLIGISQVILLAQNDKTDFMFGGNLCAGSVVSVKKSIRDDSRLSFIFK
jgi:hypothetical protein